MIKRNSIASSSSSSKECDSYRPGHQVHWIQARVEREKPRFDAEVKVIDLTQVQVCWLDQELVFYHHNTARIVAALNTNVLNYLKFAPDANLLYVQTEAPNELHNGIFSLFYLSDSELSECLVKESAVETPLFGSSLER